MKHLYLDRGVQLAQRQKQQHFPALDTNRTASYRLSFNHSKAAHCTSLHLPSMIKQ